MTSEEDPKATSEAVPEKPVEETVTEKSEPVADTAAVGEENKAAPPEETKRPPETTTNQEASAATNTEMDAVAPSDKAAEDEKKPDEEKANDAPMDDAEKCQDGEKTESIERKESEAEADADQKEEEKKDGGEENVAKIDKLSMSLDDLIQSDRQSGWGKGKHGKSDRQSGWGKGKYGKSWQSEADDSGWKKKDKSSWNDWSDGGGRGGNWSSGGGWKKSWNQQDDRSGADSGYAKSYESKSYDSKPNDKSYGKNHDSYDKDVGSYDKGGSRNGYGRATQSSSDGRGRGDGQEEQRHREDARDQRRGGEEGRSGGDRYGRSGGTSSRHQQPAEKTGEPRTVVVAGMSGLRVDRRDLERAFGSVGRVEHANVGNSTATITFREARAAREAVRRFHGGQLNERTIDVYFEGQEPSRRHSAAGGSRGGTPRSRSRSRRGRGTGGGSSTMPRTSRRSPARRTRR
mmetsp:Transcript_131832/g.263089  ORF Transcript_131832/g.263089 Transcript_131832/m.263089 type:complete len:460 (+) Transcript_131832:120-1499(+)